MAIRTIEYEIESIEVINDRHSGLNEQPFDFRCIVWVPAIKIIFKTGEIIETYLHTRNCSNFNFISILSPDGSLKTTTERCAGKYNFTGGLSKDDGWENRCSKCNSLTYGPIYIDTEKQRKPADDKV